MRFVFLTVLSISFTVPIMGFPSNGGTPPLPNYNPGWCGFHFRQYQKNEGPGDQSKYRFDVTIYDAKQVEIGSASLVDSPAGIDSQLPYVLILTAGNVDADPVYVAYAGQHFDSYSPTYCRTGGYDSGSRQGDCGFSC